MGQPLTAIQERDPSGDVGPYFELNDGKWYAAALDTGILPRELIEKPLRETLSDPAHKFGSLVIYWNKGELPPYVGPAIREAKGATVWVIGQWIKPIGSPDRQTVPLPPQVLAVEQLKDPKPTPGPLEKVEPEKVTKDEGVSTTTIVVAVAGVAAVAGGLVWLAWWMSKKKKNPRRRRRR